MALQLIAEQRISNEYDRELAQRKGMPATTSQTSSVQGGMLAPPIAGQSVGQDIRMQDIGANPIVAELPATRARAA